MRTSHRNPDDPQEEWRTCPSCHAWMLPLRDFEIQKSSAAPTVGAELWEFLLWGWTIFVANYISDALTYNERKRKLALLKSQTLPQFSNSLLCPHCLHVVKRP